MKSKLFFLLIALLAFGFSCNKEEDRINTSLEIRIKNTSNLNIQVSIKNDVLTYNYGNVSPNEITPYMDLIMEDLTDVEIELEIRIEDNVGDLIEESTSFLNSNDLDFDTPSRKFTIEIGKDETNTNVNFIND